ncbi:MAG: aminotransferase class I/II-fold pyridoxal phosphate-dependent enzyme [Emergencia sp.]
MQKASKPRLCQINVERLESLITEKTKALIINSPSNPIGNCLTVETMKKIGEVAEKHDIVVVADDIYTAFSYQNPFVPFASLPGMNERTIVLNSFSKNFTMTGWRIGTIIAPADIIKVISRSMRMLFLQLRQFHREQCCMRLDTEKRFSLPWLKNTERECFMLQNCSLKKHMFLYFRVMHLATVVRGMYELPAL